MKNLIKASIAMAAFAALFVLPSVASAIQLTHPTGTTAPVGLLITGTNVAHAGTAQHTLMETGIGNVTCSSASLTGKLVRNEPNGAHVVGEITKADFTGPEGEHCTSPLGKTTVTPSLTSETEHNGAKSLPWCVTAGAEDTITVFGQVGGSCTNGQSRALFFTLHIAGGLTCGYSKASVTGLYTTHSAAAIATISNQEFTRVTSNSAFCPPSGKLKMAFTLETDAVNPTDLYIDLK